MTASATLTPATAGALEPAEYVNLKTADRCDGTTLLLKGKRGSCPAQALVRLESTTSAAKLDFCAHCYNTHKEKLASFVLVEDVRHTLKGNPLPELAEVDDDFETADED